MQIVDSVEKLGDLFLFLIKHVLCAGNCTVFTGQLFCCREK